MKSEEEIKEMLADCGKFMREEHNSGYMDALEWVLADEKLEVAADKK